jgi:undecaprenyl-diphosphatase
MHKKNYLILSIICLIAFLVILAGINSFNFDKSINNYFSGSQNSLLLSFSLIIAFIFDTASMIIIILITSFILWFYKKRKEAVFLILLLVADDILVYLFKHIIKRARPENLIETGFSFPSGHSMIAVVFLGFMIYFFAGKIKNKPAKIGFIAIAIALVLLASLSRLILGVHWFTDVLAGLLLGLFILLGGIWVRKIY